MLNVDHLAMNVVEIRAHYFEMKRRNPHWREQNIAECNRQILDHIHISHGHQLYLPNSNRYPLEKSSSEREREIERERQREREREREQNTRESRLEKESSLLLHQTAIKS